MFVSPIHRAYKIDIQMKCHGTFRRLQSVSEDVNFFFQQKGQLPCGLRYVYINSIMPMDAWGMPIRYKYRNDKVLSYKLYSAGPDHKFTTSDDIVLVSTETDKSGSEYQEKCNLSL